MLRRYRKLKEDMPLSAAKIEDDTLQAGVLHQDKCLLSSSISIYLHLSSSTFFYLLLSPSTEQVKLATVKLMRGSPRTKFE